MSSASNLVAAGDRDGDDTDDLIGVWSSGLWWKDAYSGTWERLTSSSPSDIAAEDLDGSGGDEIIGIWPSGVFYMGRDWVLMCLAPPISIAAGDINGGGMVDLIGTWNNGLWVLYAETGTWEKITASLPNDISAGLFRTGSWDADALGYIEPIGGYAEGPGSGEYIDLSDEGPEGRNFVYVESDNLIPQEKDSHATRTPGPGEPGFTHIEQKNLVPQESIQRNKAELD
jgi:hypothetical protein